LLSLANTLHILSAYPIRICCPQGLDLHRDPGLCALLAQSTSACSALQTTVLPAAWFASVQTYNQLMLSPLFYEQFIHWQYILLVQLDAWLFSADLAHWLRQGYAYIGAPILSPPELPLGLGVPAEIVGNGGLSLRHVRLHRRVVSSWRFSCLPVLGLRELLVAHAPLEPWHRKPSARSLLRLFNRVFLVLLRLVSWRNSLAYYARCGLHEDILLGFLAPRIFPRFSVPGPALAARFSLDENPAHFQKRYLEPAALPFGCHAWQKSYEDFWRTRFEGFPRP
jgi:hypothetical protein